MALMDRPLLGLRAVLIRSRPGTLVLRAIYRGVSRIAPYAPRPSRIPPDRLESRVPVEVRPSSISGAGLGVFALEPIEAGVLLGEYAGDAIDTVARSFRLRDRDYLVCTADPRVRLDALRHPEVVYRHVCHHPQEARRNVRFRPEGLRVFVESTRRIEAGEELFADYGGSYWRVKGVDPRSD